jgi:hypothetical protein
VAGSVDGRCRAAKCWLNRTKRIETVVHLRYKFCGSIVSSFTSHSHDERGGIFQIIHLIGRKAGHEDRSVQPWERLPKHSCHLTRANQNTSLCALFVQNDASVRTVPRELDDFVILIPEGSGEVVHARSMKSSNESRIYPVSL